MEALLSVPLQIALEKVAKVIEEEILLFADCTDSLEEIQNKLVSINAVLVDAETKQITNENVRFWLSKLKGVALDIEDVVEEWQISAESHEDDDESMVRNIWSTLTSPFKRRGEVAGQVEEIRKRLDAIDRDRHMFGFNPISGGSGKFDTMHVRSDSRQTSSFFEESEMIGRDKDKETVINWLVSDAEDGQQQQQKDVHVTAIVGVGGLGKTTLAQQIVNDPKVNEHFNQYLYWVCVSDVFDVIKVTEAILQEVNKGKGASSISELNALQHELLKSLRGKRFLLVLDDVWNENEEKWKQLRLPLKSGAEGSRILVTTRIEKVAEIMHASRIHKLEGLSDDLSWKLFSSRAFLGKMSGESSKFESIGRKIAKKCKGVPLSIKLMGSTMKEKTSMADWQKILDSEMWSLPEVKNGILPGLQLSYYNLPPHLKQCFAYCSIYQKDAAMKKHELVNLWVAQGFIQPQGIRDFEDIGDEYFNGLVARSMFQEVRENYEKQTTCKMHDLLHDLATDITKYESYIFAEKMSNPQCSSLGGARHASFFLSKDNASISIASCPVQKLRTLFVNVLHENRGVVDELFRQARFLRALAVTHCWRMVAFPEAMGEIARIKKLLDDAFGKMKHLRYLSLRGMKMELPESVSLLVNLRYLDLSGTEIKELPEVSLLVNLRYLDLSQTEIEELPESVSLLVDLRTLKLNRCRKLKKLCAGISKIVGLRHLYIEDTNELFLPKGIGELTSLQSLSKFTVGRDEGECGIDELQKLNDLQGYLRVEGLDRVSEAGQATRAQLCNKQCVRELVLDISSGKRGAEDDKEEERIKVLECLRPHPNLQHLALKGYSVSKLTLPSWMGDPSFSNLSSISIDCCPTQGNQWSQWNPNSTMPGLGKLPGLKRLEIFGVGVRKLGDDFYYGIGMMSSGNDGVDESRRGVAFPKLEYLRLWALNELEEWELTGEADASKIMPSLRELKVYGCPKLQRLPSHLAIAPLSSSSSTSSEVLEESKNSDDELKPLPPHPDRGLIPLERLTIEACQNLQSLPNLLGRLKKLKSLCIRGVENLESLPDSLVQLESLESLEIDDRYDELKLLLPSLGRLKNLTIRDAEKLESLPDSLGQLASLESLRILGYDKLKSLPDSLGQLKKLKSLDIWWCKELESLPDSLQQLSLLQKLHINECPKLPYKPDWPQISHIKTVSLTKL